MGVFWRSHAEIATTEPEQVKQLIETISREEFEDGTPTSAYDFRIDGTSLFFTSNGYGCYGIEEENPGPLLFEKLFERFDGALACFEYVVPCQGQDYYMSSTWVKAEGEVDWDDDECFGKHLRKSISDGSLSEDNDEWGFEIVDVWNIPFSYLEEHRERFPHLHKAYIQAKENGFENWDFFEDKPYITHSVACEIAEEYSNDEMAVLEECSNDMELEVSEEHFVDFLCVDLPDNFPELTLSFPTPCPA